MAFKLNSFSDMYLIINDMYHRYELGEGLPDEQRISEYKYINEQLRKFVSGKQDQILGFGSDLRGMAENIRIMFKTLPEYAEDRKMLIYNFVRDAWLIELLNVVMFLIDDEEEE